MPLTKITKKSIRGSLLLQYKYIDLSDSSLTSNTQGFTRHGEVLELTPLVGDSILEVTFSANIRQGSTGDDDQYEFALYINGEQEYLESQLLGGQASGNAYSQHGGEHDRITSHVQYASFADKIQNVGLVHCHQPGNTNKQEIEIRFRCVDSNSKSVHMTEGFLIAKEMGADNAGLSGTLN